MKFTNTLNPHSVKKIVLILVLLTACFLQNNFAQENEKNKLELQKLYQLTVAKMAQQKIKSFEATSADTALGLIKVSYEKKHFCPCDDKKCNGPRIIITISSKKTDITIFPDGDCFTEIDYFSPDVKETEIDVAKEQTEDLKIRKIAKQILSDYSLLQYL